MRSRRGYSSIANTSRQKCGRVSKVEDAAGSKLQEDEIARQRDGDSNSVMVMG